MRTAATAPRSRLMASVDQVRRREARTVEQSTHRATEAVHPVDGRSGHDPAACVQHRRDGLGGLHGRRQGPSASLVGRWQRAARAGRCRSHDPGAPGSHGAARGTGSDRVDTRSRTRPPVVPPPPRAARRGRCVSEMRQRTGEPREVVGGERGHASDLATAVRGGQVHVGARVEIARRRGPDLHDYRPDAQSTQRTDHGRASRRSSGISFPHRSQIP